MNIYVTHSSSIDYKNELYLPIMESDIYKKHKFILPHLNSENQFNSKDFINNNCDLIIAEISKPSIWMWIELWWWNIKWCKIICIYKKWSNISNSIKVISNTFIEYNNKIDLIEKLSEKIEKI